MEEKTKITKRVGIVADSYKIPKYVEELTKRGYNIGSLTPGLYNTVSLTVEVLESQVQDIAKLCRLLESQFKSN